MQSKKTGEKSKDSQMQEPTPSAFFGSLSLIIILVFAFKSSILDANNIPSGSMIPTLKIGDFLFVNKMRYSFRMPFTEKEIYRFDDPKRGDIVTFAPPRRALYGDDEQEHSFISSLSKKLFSMFSKRFVKRVVGMPGDTLRITQKKIKNLKGIDVSYTFIEYKEANSNEFKSYSPQLVNPGKELSDLDNQRANEYGKTLFQEEKRNFKHFVLEGIYAGPYGFLEEYCGNETCVIPEGHYMVMGDNRDDSSDSRVWGFVKREDILGKALIIYFSINWKDYSCMYKDDIEELDSKNSRLPEKEIDSNCQAEEKDLTKINDFHAKELNSQWALRTLRYRIWRMKVRWKRIGTILQ